ncbi:MAG: secondary thiamine-phosphate synthase enzyme YjbQ [Thermodesulfovibrionales bacterium]|nr:secondary thiamine-phosphate synthase enzyme YjbQ [Thermodesulfovibrionales bacterium]
MIKTLSIKSKTRTELIDITEDINRIIKESGIKSGVCYLYVPHTTAAITINEGADFSVRRDIMATLNKLIPASGDYQHLEGNSDAHIKSSLIGVSAFVFFEDSKLIVGTWQSIFFCEFDGPRSRKVLIKIV